jgi:cytochrome c553
VEAEQYSGSKKAHAHDNLVRNPLFTTLMETILRPMTVRKGMLRPGHPTMNAKHETCLACHGTTVTVVGTRQIESDAGIVEVPDLRHWPNQGVGRVNPDGSFGACTACHPRHGFSIEIARKPETCGQCHLEPDVPGYNVYRESKHGNIADGRKEKWTWDTVPWSLGRDFSAPTCAVCHNALVVNTNNATVAERTHDFGSRLWVRLFGLIYSHPQPVSGKTYEILNADKLPLPTTLAGSAASTFLIPPDEQGRRRGTMAGICRNCHGSDWTGKHFAKLDSTLVESDAMTLAATGLLQEGWRKGVADRTNPFDEPIEQAWARQWLFYANSVRSASAMAGPDYAAFKHGWWDLTENLQHLQHLIGGKQGK